MHRRKVKGWKKLSQATGDEKKAEAAMLISDEIDFKTKTVIKDKGGYYTMIKGSTQQEDITFVNIYTLT